MVYNFHDAFLMSAKVRILLAPFLSRTITEVNICESGKKYPIKPFNGANIGIT